MDEIVRACRNMLQLDQWHTMASLDIVWYRLVPFALVVSIWGGHF